MGSLYTKSAEGKGCFGWSEKTKDVLGEDMAQGQTPRHQDTKMLVEKWGEVKLFKTGLEVPGLVM